MGGGNRVKLRRGFSPSGSPKPSQEEHDGEEDEAPTLVGRRRHDEEGSWMWRDMIKLSIGRNMVGGRGIVATMVKEVASCSRCHLGLLTHSR
ncbi:hypothetical protein BHM03_00006843 [Ensete ventricosum]|nr:hypothetical protein BHM03_00006843 [Ensete ventricosum]